MLKSVLLFLVTLLATVAAQAQSITARSLGGPVARDVAYFSQVITLVEGSVVYGSVAPLTTSVDGFGTTKLVTKLQGSPVGQMPQISVANPADRGAALAKANQWVDDEMPVFQAVVGRWLRSQGISIAIYNFNQEFMMATATGAKRMAIVFNATIDSNGRPLYGAPKIVDPDPTFVEAVYTSLQPAQGLPTSWQYPNAGTIRWRLLNKRYEEISTWQTIQAYGAYDAPQGDGDPDAGLNCLVDARNPPGCASPTESIRQIMDRTGASFGLLSYIRQLAPVYELDASGNETAVSAISVDRRTYDCGTYTNEGVYGYVLDLTADLYLLQPRADSTYYSQVQSFSGKGVSPVQPYYKAVPNTALGGRHPDTVIISPLPDDTELWSRSDPVKMKNVIYVAPVTDVGGGGALTFTGGPNGYLGFSGGTHRYSVGDTGDNYWASGVYDVVASFTIPSKDAISSLRLIRAKWDDLMLVNLNGYNVWIGPESHLPGADTLYIEYVGTAERYCEQGASSYTCAQYGAYAGPSTWGLVVDSASGTSWYGYSCPAGTLWNTGDNNCYYPGTPRTYKTCTAAASSTSDTWQPTGTSFIDPQRAYSYVAGDYQCYNSACGPGFAQYRTDATGGATFFNRNTGGCIYPELATSWDQALNVDMTPYLKAGENNIFIRTIVSGNGEGFMEIAARTCSADLNLTVSAPVGPGAQGIMDALTPKAQ